jgi:hypothetical protein
MHSNDRKWISIVEFVSSREQLFQSLIIFVDKIVQKAWTNAWSKFAYAISHNDWIDNEIDLIWLTDVFHFQIVNLRDRRLLLLDEHVSHVSMKFIEFCWLMNIVLLCFSSHTIHYLQSLDVDCVESYWLAKEWIATAAYLKWMRNSAYYIENLLHSSIYWSLIFWFIEIHLKIEIFVCHENFFFWSSYLRFSLSLRSDFIKIAYSFSNSLIFRRSRKSIDLKEIISIEWL